MTAETTAAPQYCTKCGKQVGSVSYLASGGRYCHECPPETRAMWINPAPDATPVRAPTDSFTTSIPPLTTEHPAMSSEPIQYRNEEAGFVEFVNEDVPYIVREIDGHVAIILDMETRNVIGYRVYDPAALSQPALPGQEPTPDRIGISDCISPHRVAPEVPDTGGLVERLTEWLANEFLPATVPHTAALIAEAAAELSRLRGRVAELELMNRSKVVSYRDEQTASLTAATEDNKRLRDALARQCDNMAFIINNVDILHWHDKFLAELEQDRAALTFGNPVNE